MATDTRVSAELVIDTSSSQNAMRSLGRVTKELTSEMKLNEAEMKRDGVTSDNLRTKQKLLEKQIDAQKKTIAAVEKEYVKVCNSKGKDSKEAQALKSKLIGLNTTLANQEAQLKKTTTEADKLGTELDDTKTSADNLKKSGVNLGDALKKGLTAAKDVAAELAESIKAICETTWNITIEAATRYDDAATAALMNGVTYEEYMKTMYAAQTSDIDPSAYYNAFTKFQTKYNTGEKSGLEDLRKELGLTKKEFNALYGEMLNSGDWLGVYEKILAGGGLTNEQIKALFGEESVKKLQTVMGENWDKFAESRENALEVGFVMTVDEQASLIALSDAYATLQNNWNAMKDNLGALFSVSVEPVVSDAAGLVGDVSAAIQKSFEEGQIDVDAVQTAVAEWLPKIFGDGAALLKVGKVWIDLLNGLFNGGAEGLASLFDPDDPEAQAALEEWRTAAADLWGDGENGLTGLFNNIKKTVLIPIWNWITEKMAELGGMLWNAVVNAIPEGVRGHLGIQTTEEQEITADYNANAETLVPETINELVRPDARTWTAMDRYKLRESNKDTGTTALKDVNIVVNADVADGTDLGERMAKAIEKALADLDRKSGLRTVGGGGRRVRLND